MSELTQDYIDRLLAWEAEGKGREITIETRRNWQGVLKITVRIWDGERVQGAYATYPDFPDIDSYVEEQEKAELARLQAKYGGAA